MTTTPLTDLERKALDALLSPDNPAASQLRHQLASVTVKKRDNTGVGLFVELDVPDQVAIADKERKVMSNLSGQMAGLQNGFGGVLYVENGKLHTLEFFTYDEEWPANPSGYTLRIEKANA
jgi:hypothetical protein